MGTRTEAWEPRVGPLYADPSKDFVKPHQGVVKGRPVRSAAAQAEHMTENILAAVIGIGLLIYLTYALIRPEKF